MSTKFMTRKGACAVTTDLDKLATTFETHWEAMGVPERIAHDFALRCDLLSDAIDAKLTQIEASVDSPVDETGLSVEPDGEGFDANAIADDVGGPHEQESDESYMSGEFSQQETHELRDRQESGSLPAADPRRASLDRLAAMARQSSSNGLRSLADRLKACTARLEASKAPGVGSVASDLKAMAASLDKAADGLLKLDATGEGSPELIVSADRMAQAVGEILPHLEGLEVMVVDQASPTALLEYEQMMEDGFISKLVSLAGRLVADASKDMGGSSKEAAEDKDEDEEEGEGKEAAQVNEQVTDEVEQTADKKASADDSYDLFAV